MSYKLGFMVGAAAALLVTAAWQCAPAMAGPLSQTQISSNVSSATEVRSIAVSYGDLDLTTHAGVAALYRRIDAAAGYACGWQYFTGSRAISRYWLACKTRAARNAIASLDLESLSNYARRQATLARVSNHRTASRARSG